MNTLAVRQVPAAVRPRKVLLAEDNVVNQRVAVGLLNRRGHHVTIVENGKRTELALGAGATESVCPSGCFVTLPNGDRVALNGDETVEITGGSAVVK